MDLNPEARRVLALASAARTPSPQDKARVEAQLALALGVSATVVSSVAAGQAVASASAVSAKSAAGYVFLKWGLGVAALVAAATGSYLARPNVSRPVDSEVSPPQLAERALPEPPAAVAPASEADPEPASFLQSRKEQRASTPPHPRRAASAVGPSALELSLLHRAQVAWRAGEAGRALALLKQHGQRFPRSSLGLERDALRVLNLCELGDTSQARKLARQLLLSAPHSPMRTSIEQSCALK